MTADGVKSQIAVLGGGLMGQGIAALLLAGGHDVVVWELPNRVDESVEQVRHRLTALPHAAANAGDHLLVTSALAVAMEGAAYVIECLPENLKVKSELLGEADALAKPGTIFLTNTSSIPLASLHAKLRQDRVLAAAHFFNPAEIVPGVEMSVLCERDRPLVERFANLLRALGKSPVFVAPTTAYIANRLQLALFREASLCLGEGIASAADIDAVVRSTIGFRLPSFGPFEIADMAGLKVFAAILANLQDNFGDRFSVPRSLQKLVDDNQLGIASGQGYYTYKPEDREQWLKQRDKWYRAVLAASRPAVQ